MKLSPKSAASCFMFYKPVKLCDNSGNEPKNTDIATWGGTNKKKKKYVEFIYIDSPTGKNTTPVNPSFAHFLSDVYIFAKKFAN